MVPTSVFGRGLKLLRSTDVLLAVEVVSPGSVTTDRITKPAQYAAAGIRSLWRVETRPELSLTAYALVSGERVYTEVGTWTTGQTAQLSEPFAVEVAVDDIVPVGRS